MSKVERRNVSLKVFLELQLASSIDRQVLRISGELLLMNWERSKSWAKRRRSRMGAPIRRHVVDGNMSSEVPVCLNVSIKSEGVGDFVVSKHANLIGLSAD